jgi:erythromycin esterase-like protein
MLLFKEGVCMQRGYRTREDTRHLAGHIFLLVATVAAVALLAVANGDEDVRIAWLDEHAVPLAGCEAEHGFDDLAPLAAMIGDARIVGLGESTHGTREHFQMKHRLVEYLVEELGFSWFAIEASTPEAHRLDAYVLGGDGDPEALIRGMYFWTWTTEEVLAMVEWMRAYNARSDQKIHFTGFDMQTPDVAADEVIRFLREVESATADRAAEQYANIVKADAGPSFATATYTIDPDEARGAAIRFTAWIRTANVRDGYAGLWCRIDGPEGGVFAFDNMNDRGLSGTTDWTECAIELPVDEEADRIVFGFLLTGYGNAWFDAASLEADGASLNTTALDLGFEGTKIHGAHTNLGVYSSLLDRAVAYEGAQSLRLEGVDRDPAIPLLADVLPDAETILAEMEASRDEWLARRPTEEIERALLNARIVVQYLRMKAGSVSDSRDAAMAENVAWLAEQYPEERLILWAHNYHVSRAGGAMGAHLADRYGDDYVPVGFATAYGEYYAVGMDGRPVHDLQAPTPESFEAHFAAAAAPIFVVDLREVEMEETGSAWLSETRPFRSVGALARDEQFYPTPLRDYYDLIVFVEETTAARQL